VFSFSVNLKNTNQKRNFMEIKLNKFTFYGTLKFLQSETGIFYLKNVSPFSAKSKNYKSKTRCFEN
jgi:hypothetical protein